jgi:hypothetical protein
MIFWFVEALLALLVVFLVTIYVLHLHIDPNPRTDTRWQRFKAWCRLKCSKCKSTDISCIRANTYGDPGYHCNGCGYEFWISTEGR